MAGSEEELVVKVPGKMKGRGARISKLVKPRPPKHSLAQLNRNKLTLEHVPYSTDMEKRLEGQGVFDEAHCDSGLNSITLEIMESPAKKVLDENNNVRQSLDFDDIDVEIKKRPCRLEDVEISAIISTTDNSSVTDSEDYVDALEYLAPHEAETVVEVLQVPETEHKLVQAPQVAETEHKLVQAPRVAEKENELVQAPQVADADHVGPTNRRVFPTRQLSVINSTMAMNRVRTPSGTDHAVVNSKVQENSQECSRVDEVIQGELEHMEQIVYNLQSYQFLHPEVICMCDSLKKTVQKIKSYFPARTSKLFTELKRVAKLQVRGVHPTIPKHLIACGVVTIEKEQTIGQLSAVSTKALSKAFTDVAYEEVEQDGEPTTALLATVSSETVHTELTSAVIESNRRPTLPQVRESHGAKESTAYPGSDKSSNSGAQQSKATKRVAFVGEPARQPHNTIGVNAPRTSCGRKEITFTLEEKLKTVSSWPPSMLEGFLNDSKDPVDAVKRLVTSLEAECRFVSRSLRCETRAETHTCKCEVAGRSFPVGYGFSVEEAKVEAALNVLTNTIGGPRDRFIKKELHQQSIKKDHAPIVVPHRSNDTTRSTEDWQQSHPPHPNRNNRITSPTKSVCLSHSTPKKQPHVSTDSLWKKLRLVVRYPTPTLQTYLDDLSDPIASVAHLSYCLEWKETFMNDVITDDSQEKLHSSICRIGNLAFTPGYGVDIQTAKNEAARNAINEILSTAKENAK